MKHKSSAFRSTAAVLVALLCGAASAQITKQGSAYLFRMKFAKGDVVKYAVSTTTTGAGAAAMSFKMPMTSKVLSVAKGVGEVEYTVGPMTNNGKPMGQVQKSTAKIDARGKVTGDGAQLQQMGNITLPAKAIKIGESWKGTQTAQAGPAGSLTMNATYTLVGVKTVRGRQVAEVKLSVAGGNEMLKTSGTGIMQLLVSDCSLYSTSLDQTISISQGQQAMSIKNKVTIVRQ